jgi:hypothetical protein
VIVAVEAGAGTLPTSTSAAGILELALGYRDDNEALRARVRALEGEVKRLEVELEGRDAPIEAPAPDTRPAAAPELAVAASEVQAMVLAREQEALRVSALERQAAERERARRVALYARRPRRVTAATAADGSLQITIDRRFLSDSLREQWQGGIVFAFFNPGLFVMLGLLYALYALGVEIVAAALLAVPLWAALLGLINVAYARLANARYRLDVTGDGHFALYTRSPRRPLLLGRRSQLRADIDKPDPSALGKARLSDGATTVTIDHLTAADLAELRRALGISE